MPKRVQWDFSIALPALGIHGINTEPPIHVQGSHADIYEHPIDPGKLIKVTNDNADAQNILNAQTLNSSNVVKCYGLTTVGVFGGTALLVDFVKGSSVPYTTPEFLSLMEGQHGTEPRDQAHLRILRPDQYRAAILQSHGRMNRAELLNLSQLFRTIHLLESQLNIFLVDFADNVIDNGQAYVVVDLGR